MNVNTLAKLTLFGLAYIYTTKLIDTLYHGIFRPAPLVGTIVGLNILAGMVQLLVFSSSFIGNSCRRTNRRSMQQAGSR